MLCLDQRGALQTPQGLPLPANVQDLAPATSSLEHPGKPPLPADVQGIGQAPASSQRSVCLCLPCVQSVYLEMALNREDMEPMTGMIEEERRLVKVSMACRS